MGRLLALLGWRSWGVVRYNSVLQNAMALFYLALAYRQFSWSFLGSVGLFTLLSLSATAYGYLINDWADRQLDQEHGKSNVLAQVRPAVALTIVTMVGGISVAMSTLFWARPGFLLTFAVWFSLATFYSLPPLRLKVRGGMGLAATILAQQTMPALMVFAAFGRLWRWETLIFVLYVTCRGATSDIAHQMRDRGNDENTDTRTVAVRRGHKWIASAYAWALEAEKLMLGIVMLFLVLRLPAVPGFALRPAWLLLVFYLLLYAVTAGRTWSQIRRGRLIDPHDPYRQATTRDAYQMIHHSFPSVAAPLYLALWMMAYFWPNVIFVVVLGARFKLWSPRLWIGTFRGWMGGHGIG